MPADYPSAIHTARTIANRPGVVYDADDTKTFFAEDLNEVNDEVIALENELGTLPKGLYASVKERLTNSIKEVTRAGLKLAFNFNLTNFKSPIVLDSSGLHNHCTVTGGTHQPNGGPNGGGAFDLNGSGNYIDTAIKTPTADSFTVLAWIKIQATNINNAICGEDSGGGNRGWFLRATNTAKIRFYMFATTTVSQNDIDTPGIDQWIFVGGVYDSATKICKCMVNGVLSAGNAIVGDRILSDVNFSIGKASNVAFDGQIANVSFYNRVLSADEIRALYLQQKENDDFRGVAKLTTTQRDAITAPETGMTIYNTTTNKLNIYNGSGWKEVTSA